MATFKPRFIGLLVHWFRAIFKITFAGLPPNDMTSTVRLNPISRWNECAKENHAHFSVYANLPNTNTVRLAGKQTPLLEGSFSFVPKMSYGLRGALRLLEPVLFHVCVRKSFSYLRGQVSLRPKFSPRKRKKKKKSSIACEMPYRGIQAWLLPADTVSLMGVKYKNSHAFGVLVEVLSTLGVF